MGFDPISIGLMVAGTAISALGALKSQGAEAQQMRARQAMTNIQAQNERLDQVRQARIKQAQIVQMGNNQGAGESSSVTTGASGVQGQAESNIQYIGAQQNAINDIFSADRAKMDGGAISSIGGAVSGMGRTLFNPDVQSGIKQTYNNVFGD